MAKLLSRGAHGDEEWRRNAEHVAAGKSLYALLLRRHPLRTTVTSLTFKTTDSAKAKQVPLPTSCVLHA